MFAHVHSQARPPEFSMIVEPHPAGVVIGHFAGKPISEEIVDLFGRRFRFAGVAGFRRDGDVDATGLGVGEFIAEPGLIYRLIGSNCDRPAPAREAA